jgi:hypothetical protein
MTLSTPLKIVVLAALALALGTGGLLAVTAARHKTTSDVVVPPKHITPAAHVVVVKATPKPKPHKAALQLDPSAPLIIRRALEHHTSVVVAVYSSAAPGDQQLVDEARAGARAAHAGFVAANVHIESIAAAVATWSNRASDPFVLVVRRPGRVVWGVDGLTDRDTVAQAVLSAK